LWATGVSGVAPAQPAPTYSARSLAFRHGDESLTFVAPLSYPPSHAERRCADRRVSQEGFVTLRRGERGQVTFGGKGTPGRQIARDAHDSGAPSPAILRAAESRAFGCLSLSSLPTRGKCSESVRPISSLPWSRPPSSAAGPGGRFHPPRGVGMRVPGSRPAHRAPRERLRRHA
jgi:hypothetical protein